jgi:hypothetical protein
MCTSTNLQLWISGDVGHAHVLQEALSPNATSWQTVQTLSLTNDPQVIALNPPSGSAKFWRVVAE